MRADLAPRAYGGPLVCLSGSRLRSCATRGLLNSSSGHAATRVPRLAGSRRQPFVSRVAKPVCPATATRTVGSFAVRDVPAPPSDIPKSPTASWPVKTAFDLEPRCGIDRQGPSPYHNHGLIHWKH